MPIILGILVATLANHALAGSAGVWLASLLDPATLRWITAGAFFAFAVWALFPDRLDAATEMRPRSAFATTAIAFFIAEMGDKTQLATVALGARYDALAAVVLGTTLGMLVANVPAVLIGEKLAGRLDLKLIRRLAAAAFVLTGVATLI